MRNYLFIDQDISDLLSDVSYSKMKQFKHLLEQCDRYKKEVIPIEHPQKSTTYMGMAVANLSLAYLITKQSSYLQEAKRWIKTIVSYPHWGNAHLVDVDLSAAWILFGLSLSYDWIKDDLSDDEKGFIKDKLVLQANRMYAYKKRTEGHGWSTNYWQNHNWINMTGLATCGYALKEEVKDAQTWIDDAKENFAIVFDYLPEDGSDYEGVVYWRYGAMWLFVYAHLLKNSEKIDYFKTSQFLKNTFYYRLYQAAPNLEEIINFGDCHDRRSGHSAAIYYKVAAEYQNGHAQKLGNRVINDFIHKEQYESQVKPGILPEAMFTLLWFDPSVKEETFDNLPLTKYFEDLGLCIVRSSWCEDAIHFSFKSGHPGGKKQWKEAWELKKSKNYESLSLSHQHPDNNSFILNAYGSFLAIDEGYNREVHAFEHNVITVDNFGYTGDGNNDVFKSISEDAVSHIELYMYQQGMTAFIGESSKMYPSELQLTRNARHIVYSNQGYFILLDELRSELPHHYKWNMHADTVPVEVLKNTFIYENGLAKMYLLNLSPDNCTYHHVKTNVKAIMTTQEPDNYRETKMQTIQIESSKSKNVNYLNILIPSRFDLEIDKQIEYINSEGCMGVIVTGKGFKDIFLYSEQGNMNWNGIKATGSWILLQYQEDRLTTYGMHLVNNLIVDEEVLYSGDVVSIFESMK